MIRIVNNVALNVEETGAGTPVVLLHGHAHDLRVWDDLVPALVAAGHRVVRYDQRGHGRSCSPPVGYSWQDHVADLVALLAEVDARPAHLVGLSKGGGIALEAALERSAVARSLTLVEPMLPGFALSAALRDSFRALARAIATDGLEPALREHWLDHPLMASAHAQPGARERLEAMVSSFPGGEYFARREPHHDAVPSADRLVEIHTPTLVVAAEHAVEDFRAMANAIVSGVEGARRVTIAGSGHMVPLERPHALGDEVVAFLAEVDQDPLPGRSRRIVR
jgi:3-oxoadipate enol-lactonase